MVELKLFYQIGSMTNKLNATSIMVFFLGSPTFFMLCKIGVYYAIVKLKQKIICFFGILACQESESMLTIYFTVNLAFVYYFDDLTIYFEFQIF